MPLRVLEGEGPPQLNRPRLSLQPLASRDPAWRSYSADAETKRARDACVVQTTAWAIRNAHNL